MVMIAPDTNIVVLGRVGSGKTTWIQRVLIPALRRQRRGILVIFDSKDEYRVGEDVNSPMELNRMLYGGDEDTTSPPKIIRVPIPRPSMERAEQLLAAAWAPVGEGHDEETFYKPKFPVRVLIDDAPMYYMERGGQDPEWLRTWYIMGRSAQRTLVTAAQRTQFIPKGILTMSEHLVAFKMANYDIKNYVARYHGEAEANMVQSMRRYQYSFISDLLDEPLVFDPYTGPGISKRPTGVEL